MKATITFNLDYDSDDLIRYKVFTQSESMHNGLNIFNDFLRRKLKNCDENETELLEDIQSEFNAILESNNIILNID